MGNFAGLGMAPWNALLVRLLRGPGVCSKPGFDSGTDTTEELCRLPVLGRAVRPLIAVPVPELDVPRCGISSSLGGSIGSAVHLDSAMATSTGVENRSS